MKTITFESRPVRFWDFGAPDTDADGNVLKDAEGKPIVTGGNWVIRPTEGKLDTAPENLDECLVASGGKEERLCELVVAGLIAEAKQRAGVAPEGTFSKSMCSAVVKMLQTAPEFRSLQRSAKTTAVMRKVGKDVALRTALAAALESLRTAVDTEEEEES